MKKIFTLALLLFLSNAEARKTRVKMATVAPDGTPWANILQNVEKEVEAKSKNKIDVKLYLGGQLGGEIEILQGIRRGRIEGGGLTVASLASVFPEINILETPFLFESNEEADFILDNYLYEPFKKIFDKKGLVLVCWAENGWRNIGHKSKKIQTPMDLKGLKMRSQENKIHIAFWKSMGANPVPIATPEVLSSLKTGLIEGFDNTTLFTMASEWSSSIKNFTISKHIFQPAAFVYSKKFFRKLNTEQKNTLLMGSNSNAPLYRKKIRSLDNELLTIMKEQGINIHQLSSKEKDLFKVKTKNIPNKFLEDFGKSSQEIYKLILKGKEEFKKRAKKK
jgi:TRAP-type transport system periplasmic protein